METSYSRIQDLFGSQDMIVSDSDPEELDDNDSYSDEESLDDILDGEQEDGDSYD